MRTDMLQDTLGGGYGVFETAVFDQRAVALYLLGKTVELCLILAYKCLLNFLDDRRVRTDAVLGKVQRFT